MMDTKIATLNLSLGLKSKKLMVNQILVVLCNSGSDSKATLMVVVIYKISGHL